MSNQRIVPGLERSAYGARHGTDNKSDAANANAITFDRFAGVCAIITGLSSVLYAVFFLLVKGSLNTYLPSVFLALGGFLALAPLVAVYQRVRRAEEGFALWALLLAAVGYLGTAAHAIFALAAVMPKALDVGSAKTSIKPIRAAFSPSS